MSSLQQERELFEKCLRLPAAERDALLQAECPDNPQLRERVRRMLQRHVELGDSGSFFLRLGKGDPDRIGPYRILQRLGEGGMGIVYAAEQREPVRRRVAVKVLRGGYSSREVLARFDVERQALALMSHVNIARILDAGTTPDHRPFIVMEFVAGEPITQYCDRHDLPLEERLELFAEVCDAVQHAHQRGVIHRDIKPTNILVAEEDGRATPKVIDFGIAKAINQQLTEQTLETRVGSLLGTPDYMSPEQAELSPLDVDTRTDIYSLGAVLYQLLTGVTPLQLSGSGKSYPEMQRLILEKQPIPPSQCVAGPLRRQLRGELDWITLKALEKQRSHRYASASDLSRDVRAWMNDDNVMAAPPSRLRRMRKFVIRHWFGSGAVASIILILAFSQWVLVLKNRELARERDRANQEAQISRRVIGFTAGLFETANPEATGESSITARQLLDDGVKRLESEAATEPPEIRAALFAAAGNAYHGIGEHDEAERLLGLAVDEFRRLSDVDSAEFARTLAQFAHQLRDRGELTEAEKLAREAVQVMEQASLPDAGEYSLFQARADLADILRTQGEYDEAAALVAPYLDQDRLDQPRDRAMAMSLLGRIRGAQGDFDEAERLLEQAMNRYYALDGEHSQPGRAAKGALANIHVVRGKPERAEKLLREAVADARQLYGDVHPEVATALNNLANALADIPEKRQEAEATYREAIRQDVLTRGTDHPQTITVRSNLAWLYGAMQDWNAALETYQGVLESRERLLGPDHPDTANARLGVARAMRELGDPAGAEPLQRQVLSSFEQHLGSRHWRVAAARGLLGEILADLDRREEALVELETAVSIFEETLGKDHQRTIDTRAKLERLQNSAD